MDSKWVKDDNVIDVWFRLRDGMLVEDKTPTGVRPPSLRDAVYAHVLASRTATETDPETVEAFVNGIEIGAMAALRDAWNKRK
jgi:hypothetical protein